MRYVAVIAGIFAVFAMVQPALAAHHGHHGWSIGRHGHEEGRHGHELHGRVVREHHGHGGRLPLDRLLPSIRRHHPGRLLDVEPGWGPHGEPHNRVKWLTQDGRVIWLDQDARTGEIRGVEGAPPPPYSNWRRR